MHDGFVTKFKCVNMIWHTRLRSIGLISWIGRAFYVWKKKKINSQQYFMDVSGKKRGVKSCNDKGNRWIHQIEGKKATMTKVRTKINIRKCTNHDDSVIRMILTHLHTFSSFIHIDTLENGKSFIICAPCVPYAMQFFFRFGKLRQKRQR